jgi:hypothetical protein
VVGDFRNAARVDYADIGMFTLASGAHTNVAQLTSDGGRLGEIQFTTKGEV